MYGANEVVFNE